MTLFSCFFIYHWILFFQPWLVPLAILLEYLFILVGPIPIWRPIRPQRPKAVWYFHSFMAGVTKNHDFIYFSISLVPVKLLSEIFVKFWNNRKKYYLDTIKFTFWEKLEKSLFIPPKIILYLLESELYTLLVFLGA